MNHLCLCSGCLPASGCWLTYAKSSSQLPFWQARLFLSLLALSNLPCENIKQHYMTIVKIHSYPTSSICIFSIPKAFCNLVLEIVCLCMTNLIYKQLQFLHNRYEYFTKSWKVWRSKLRIVFYIKMDLLVNIKWVTLTCYNLEPFHCFLPSILF